MDKEFSSASTILLVDDNPQNLQVLGKLLWEQNYKIEFAVNGKSALDWLKNKSFDLILLDINMPGMNGFEVCRIIRQDIEIQNIPIIFLSAESERESILKGFEVGAQDFVIKPFDSRELLARVKTQLDLKSKTEKLEKVNEWLAKKIDNWLKVSLAKPGRNATDDLNTKMMEFDENQSIILKDICLELRTSVNEIEIIIAGNNDLNIRNHSMGLIKRMKDSVIKLEKL